METYFIYIMGREFKYIIPNWLSLTKREFLWIILFQERKKASDVSIK